jgi:Fe2+ transport system protein B
LKNKKYLKIFTIICFVCILITFSSVYGVDPTLVTRLNSAFKKIQEYLVKLAVPAAGVAIATGVMIRKFSFGDEEKMAIGKKVIMNAIVCYGIIISIDLIIKFVDSVLK